MSGVEIAGFVLAAFPVTVQLIQGYQEGCKHLVDWRRFQVTYLRLKQGLNRQYTIFDNNVRILLLPLVETEEELEDLLNDPGGLGWKNRDLEDALQRRLSHSYTSYLETIEALRDQFDEFKSKLGIGGDVSDKILEHFRKPAIQPGKTSTVLKKIDWNYEWKRVRISWTSKELLQLLSEIGELNQSLKDLLGDSEKIQILQQTRKSPLSSTVQQWRKHAIALYSFLARQWPCPCQSAHQAKILLKQSQPKDDKGTPTSTKKNKQQAKFEVSMLVGKAGDGSHVWRGPFKCTLQEVSEMEHHQEFESHHDAPFHNQHDQQLYHSYKKKKVQFGKEVKFQRTDLSQAVSGLNEDANALYLSSAASVTQHYLNSDPIRLCPSLCTTQHLPLSLGPFREGSFQVRMAKLGTIDEAPPSLISLGEILPRKSVKLMSSHLQHRQRRLPLPQRIRLAVELASLFFYIFDTPWCTQQWSKDLVTLAIVDQKLHGSALLERYFPDKGKTHGDLPADPQEALVRLCVCLQELCLGDAFENLDAYVRLCDENGMPQAHTYRTAAWELVTQGRIEDELGDKYSEAVKNCLIHAIRLSSSSNVKPEQWQQAHDEIVEPLRKVLASLAS